MSTDSWWHHAIKEKVIGMYFQQAHDPAFSWKYDRSINNRQKNSTEIIIFSEQSLFIHKRHEFFPPASDERKTPIPLEAKKVRGEDGQCVSTTSMRICAAREQPASHHRWQPQPYRRQQTEKLPSEQFVQRSHEVRHDRQEGRTCPVRLT
ncbi:hypothetical protein [Gluconacetobacter tumulicola]|uniref:Uncharacterized protein n=1 Tax=Gluconacetobacter tumulicola TaxID=1017177 RepID=A0A7W4JEY5_9PROT|nr:hypothetical protein [Gluconacetobacter tumulicola]MBB2179839.1 hypothetical protein [Gluconacetobacter tumulicola]